MRICIIGQPIERLYNEARLQLFVCNTGVTQYRILQLAYLYRQKPLFWGEA